jgi:hypothetical protein
VTRFSEIYGFLFAGIFSDATGRSAGAQKKVRSYKSMASHFRQVSGLRPLTGNAIFPKDSMTS